MIHFYGLSAMNAAHRRLNGTLSPLPYDKAGKDKIVHFVTEYFGKEMPEEDAIEWPDTRIIQVPFKLNHVANFPHNLSLICPRVFNTKQFWEYGHALLVEAGTLYTNYYNHVYYFSNESYDIATSKVAIPKFLEQHGQLWKLL